MQRAIRMKTYQFLDSDHRGGNKLDLSPEAADIAESLEHEIHILGLTWEQQVSEDFYFSIFGSLSFINITLSASVNNL